MPEWTRRRALLAAASSAVTLAGCGGTATDWPTIDHGPEDRIFEPRTKHVRVEEPVLLFHQDGRTPQSAKRRTHGTDEFVATSEQLQSLTFDDRPESQALQEYAAGTNFQDESVWLFSQPIEGCHEYRLLWVSIESNDEIDAEFCQPRRPADVECDADTHHTVGYAIRMPISGETVSLEGTGTSHRCTRNRGRYFDPSATPASRGEDP